MRKPLGRGEATYDVGDFVEGDLVIDDDLGDSECLQKSFSAVPFHPEANVLTVSVVICTLPKCRVSNPSLRNSPVRSLGGSSPRIPPNRKNSNAPGAPSAGLRTRGALGSRRHTFSMGTGEPFGPAVASRSRMGVVVASHAATFVASPTAEASCAGRAAAEGAESEVKSTWLCSPAFLSIWAYSRRTQGGTEVVVASSSSMCSMTYL